MENQNKDSSVHEEKVANQLDSMDTEDMDQVLNSFQTFKNHLADKVGKGEKMGLSEDVMAKAAKKTADYLADNVEPRNREEYLLNQLWDCSNEEEKKHLSHILVKMAKDEKESA